jgi:hypothetical protein
MEELFGKDETSTEQMDICLWVFPHLREFLAVDLREDAPRVSLLSASDVFGDPFLEKLEQGFCRLLRERPEYPFVHLMDLPLRLEELVRETGMLSVLDRLGRRGDPDEFPTVAVYVISGMALSMSEEQVSSAFRAALREKANPQVVGDCSRILSQLILREHEVVKRIDHQELRESLENQSPNFFTLWERRN